MSLLKAINRVLEQTLSYPDPIGDTLGKGVALGLAVFVVNMIIGLLR